ncbi:MAG: hypothetical protein IKF53_05165 [Clostridia bacterium]|nr:hypothetical protein [Clostridia bacterium]
MNTKRILKVISLLICFVMLLSFVGCGQNKVEITPRNYIALETAPDGDKVPSSGFRVGFGRTEIIPEDSVPLQGYGDALNRMSTGYLDELYVSCIAITDEDDKTLLLLEEDLTTTREYITENARKYAKETYGIEPEFVHMTSTHTHSSPDTYNDTRAVLNYRAKVFRRIHEAIDIAMADRKTAEIQVGETKTKGMNYDRHYWRSDGTAMSDNYGIFSKAPLVSHLAEPDETMRLIKFTRKKSDGSKAKDVLLVNWQCHPHLSGSAELTDASSDVIGPLTTTVEKDNNCYMAYYQGCAGNMNEKSLLSDEENNTLEGYRVYGEKLASFVTAAYNKLDKMDAGKIKAVTKNFTAPANHDQDDLVTGAREIVAEFNRTHSTLLLQGLFEKYHIHSIYQARAVIRCAGFGETYTMPVSAFCIGDIGFTTASCEMFCQSGMEIREKSPFKFTVTLSYTDEHHSYLPTAMYYDPGCYEVCITNYAKGGAELCTAQLIDMLKELHK